MKLLVIFLITISFIIGCQTSSSKVELVSVKQVAENSITKESNAEFSSIRKIDFQNFTFSWTKTFGYGEKSFTLKDGRVNLPDNRKLILKSLTYIAVLDDYDEQALINLQIDDGNATYQMLYVYAIENSKLRLLESFEFGENNIFFGTAFDAHGELVIETYNQLASDAECCPSIIEISYYKWQKDKFVLQGESQKVANGYVERTKKRKVDLKNERN